MLDLHHFLGQKFLPLTWFVCNVKRGVGGTVDSSNIATVTSVGCHSLNNARSLHVHGNTLLGELHVWPKDQLHVFLEEQRVYKGTHGRWQQVKWGKVFKTSLKKTASAIPDNNIREGFLMGS